MEVSCEGDVLGGKGVRIKVRQEPIPDYSATFAFITETWLSCQSFMKSESLKPSLISTVELFAYMQSINL